MHRMTAGRVVGSLLIAGLLAVSSGCTGLGVEMTSTPDSVRAGQPVTFDFKVTNRSQCPTQSTVAEIIAFIPADQFFGNLTAGAPSNLPPEVLAFFEELRVFFDELCAGGEPDLPTPPMFPCPAMSCSRGEGEILCQMSGQLSGEAASSPGMTFANLGDQLRCEVEGEAIRCQLRIPVPTASATASGTGAALPPEFSCLTGADDFGGQSGALCFLGTFQNPAGLGPSGMATGQVALPARGSGFVRNLIFAGSFDTTDAEDLGVCKNGPDAGEGCDQSESDSCSGGGTCGEGICQGGGNNGLGCDAATAMIDCPGVGAVCQLCNDLAENGFLPVDCTTTYIAPEGVPAMSPWGLTGLAVLLMTAGIFWLQRRARRTDR
jgi:hypothetical protein